MHGGPVPRRSTSVRRPLPLAVNDKRVQNLPGAPVSADFAFSGQTKYGRTNDDVSAIRVRLEGSEREGVLDAVGVRTSGVWGFSVLRVTAGPGRSVSLVKE